MPMLPQKKHHLRSLRVSKQDEEAILAHLDRASEQYEGQDMRRERREPYRMSDGIEVEMMHSGGVAAQMVVVPRNISANGMGFLYGNYVHLGTKCVVNLQAVDGEVHPIPAEVVRCNHVRGTAHEVGVRFLKPLKDLENFVRAYVGGDEPVAPNPELAGLSGKVLYVEDTQDDRELARFLLGKHGIDVRTVPSGNEALAVPDLASLDLVMTDYHLPDMTAPDVVKALRGKGYKGPVIAVTADESEEVRQAAITGGCSAVLIKPYALRDLLDTLKQYLPYVETDGEGLSPLYSSMWSDVTMRPLILRFLDRLAEKIEHMRHLLDAEDRSHLQQLCSEIKGSAKGYGYGQISRAARELQTLATVGQAFEELRPKASELTRLCVAAVLVRQNYSG